MKTIGRHHPDIQVDFLKKQIELKRNISKVMMRKALTYVPKEKKAEIEALL
ncbi:MAG: hypothetical protein HXS44_01445 [Theionarchaea archaeon]|nr:hypothetical protein [Theionarchaea archaeon]